MNYNNITIWELRDRLVNDWFEKHNIRNLKNEDPELQEITKKYEFKAVIALDEMMEKCYGVKHDSTIGYIKSENN